MNTLCYWYNRNTGDDGYAIETKSEKLVCSFSGPEARTKCIEYAKENNISYVEI